MNPPTAASGRYNKEQNLQYTRVFGEWKQLFPKDPNKRERLFFHSTTSIGKLLLGNKSPCILSVTAFLKNVENTNTG